MGPDRVPLNFNVTAFVGGKNLVIFYIEQQGGTVTKALPGKISKGSGKFAQKLVITIPPDLQQPAPGLYAALTDLKSTLQLKKGKNALISSVGCMKKKHRSARSSPSPRTRDRPPKPERVGHLDREVQVAVRRQLLKDDGPASAGPSSFLDCTRVLLPAPVFAHGLVGRADLPIPKSLFAAAAATVLVVSFVALAALWSTPRLQEVRERRLFRLPLVADAVLGVVGVAVFCVSVYAGLAGTDSEQDNLAPTVVFVILWVGVPFVSLVFGDVFRLLSPWRAIGRVVGWVVARVAAGRAARLPGPPRALAGDGGHLLLRRLRAVLGGRRASRRRWRSSGCSTSSSCSSG